MATRHIQRSKGIGTIGAVSGLWFITLWLKPWQTVAADRAAWLRRLLLSMLAAIVVGGLVFLITRAATSAVLFAQQQQFLAEVGNTLRSGIAGLPASNLRELRQRVQALDAQNLRLSLLAGFGAAALAAAGMYLWLEHRAIAGQRRPTNANS